MNNDINNTEEVVIPVVILIIFIVFFGAMLYLLISSGFQTTSPDNPVSSDKRTSTTFACGIGQCATNLQSGFKTCPPSNESITIDPSQEVCNSPFVCDNLLTPYALQSDGSTDLNGVCEPNVQCPCLAISQCPEYVLSAFTTSNGNAYQPLPGQRILFPQISSFVNSNTGVQTDVPPIQFNNPSLTFCAASLSFLPLSSPGCNFVDASHINSVSYSDLILCMGGSVGCSGLHNNPCLQGVLAILSPNPDELTQSGIQNYQYACVRGEPCPCGQVNIFDTNYGGIVCRNLPES